MSYSKGKWSVRGNKIFIGDSYRCVASVWVQKNFDMEAYKAVEDVEANANAKLIATAPELLEACKWALEQFKRLADEGHYPQFMLQQNGGQGVMPLVNAIDLATK